MRTKPLKEKCSYYFNQTLVFYEMDPGNTVNRGSCPGWSRLLMRKAEKSSVHSRAFLPSFITCRVVCQCCRNHSLGGLRYLIRGRKSRRDGAVRLSGMVPNLSPSIQPRDSGKF